MEAFTKVKLWSIFIHPLKYLTMVSCLKLIPRGYYYLNCQRSTGNFNASFRRHYLFFLAPIFPLKNFTLPDGLTTRWHVDLSVTCDGNLERIDAENICSWHKCQHVYTQNRWFSDTFSRAYGSFNLKKIWSNWKLLVTVSSRKEQRNRLGIAYN